MINFQIHIGTESFPTCRNKILIMDIVFIEKLIVDC